MAGEISEPYKKWLATNMALGCDRVELLRKAAAQGFDIWRIAGFLELSGADIPSELRPETPVDQRILVQIASYRDPECRETIDNLFRQALHPERVYVAICWQHLAGDPEPVHRDRDYGDRVRLIAVDAHDSQGVCWARRMTQHLWTGEEFTLVTDSHMRFIPGWDAAYIAELERCPSDKPLLSCTPASYVPPNDLERDPKPTLRRPDFFNNQGEMRCKGLTFDRAPDAPIRGAFIAAGFMFSRAEVIREVPYDPYCYFNQEEVLYSIRLWTHGWDVYHPSLVTAYHYYFTPKVETKALHWKDSARWTDYQKRGLERFNYLTEHDSRAGVDSLSELRTYGLGNERSLDGFQLFTGVDFRAKKISLWALQCGFISGLREFLSGEIHIPELFKEAAAEKVQSQILDPADLIGTTLVVGGFLPWLRLTDIKDRPRTLQLYAGANCLITFTPVDRFAETLKAFGTADRSILAGNHHKIWVLIDTGTPSPETRAEILDLIKAGRLPEESVWLMDGAAPIPHIRSIARDVERKGPHVVCSDRNLKITACHALDIDGADAQTDNREIFDTASRVLSRDWTRLGNRGDTQAPAPVLLVERVLPPELCERLISLWREGRKFTGRVGSGDRSVVNKQAKRRSDVHPSREICAELDTILASTLLPEIRKVFGLEITNREMYKVGVYDSSDGGFFLQHRDNHEEELQHRRVALTLNLNDDFEGGELSFPEYADQGYKPGAGSCVVFPCALMHQANPVRSGTRFMLVTFMFEKADEIRRRRYCERHGRSHNADLFEWTHGGAR